METFGIEAIVSLALAGLTLILAFIGHYFYVRGKLHKAAAGAIANAEQEDKTGKEKLEIAVEQVYSLIPTTLKLFIYKCSVRKIVQTAFDKIEDYAIKQVNKKAMMNESSEALVQKKEEDDSALKSEVIVSPKNNCIAFEKIENRAKEHADKTKNKSRAFAAERNREDENTLKSEAIVSPKEEEYIDCVSDISRTESRENKTTQTKSNCSIQWYLI